MFILFYSFKGGVGKTTLLLQLALKLTKDSDKKILIIDLDPQCNSTIFLKNRKNEEPKKSYYEKNINTPPDSLNVKDVVNYHVKEKLLRPLNVMNEWDMITVLKDTYFIEETRDIKDIYLDGTQSIKTIMNNIWQINYLKYKDEFKAINYEKSFLKNLYLIKGSLEVEELSNKMNSDGKFIYMTRLFFIEILNKFDYIFIDLNPGLSKINQLMLLCSDKIIVPIGNDPFSMASIINLPKILKNVILNFILN